MSKRCQKCNAILDDVANFCSVCGSKQSPPDDEQTGLLINEEKTGPLIDEKATDFLNKDDREEGERNPKDAYFGRPGYIPVPPMQSTPNAAMEQLDYRQFYYRYASKKTKGLSITLIVICFITAAASIISILFGNILSIVDFIYYFVFAFLMLAKKTYVFPLAVTIYSGIFSLFGLLTTGIVSGVVAMVIGIMCVVALWKVKCAYEAYKKTGILPNTHL